MVNIRFFVVDFASHRTWVEGLKRALQQYRTTPMDVRYHMIPSARWKWRMQVAAAELQVADDDDIVVVDGMLDVTPLMATLTGSSTQRRPSVLVYLHENQLCTPFTGQDRDRRGQTHWHYGMAHWRSLLASDGFVFNSQTQLKAFATALPKLINEQCPRDTVEWHLAKAAELLQAKCTVLHYGLELRDLSRLSDLRGDRDSSDDNGTKLPTILWNARLEEDKDPSTFIDVLKRVRDSGTRFHLTVLGVDYTKGSVWKSEIEREFAAELRFFGWCTDRQGYGAHLKNATVVMSTAQHETFGISIVESVVCGALPLLPNRLSYPELLSPEAHPGHFFENKADCATKLKILLKLQASEREKVCSSMKEAMMRFDWECMAPRYVDFFSSIARGDDVQIAGMLAASDDSIDIRGSEYGETIRIHDAKDPKVALFRPKSLRDATEYAKQIKILRSTGIEPSLHGGRRAVVRMLDAIASGTPSVRLVSALTTHELARGVFGDQVTAAPVYVAEKNLIDTVRGIKLNTADAVLAMVHFPIASPLSELLANPPILILDNVRNGENAGSLLRTAFCLGIRSVIASVPSWGAIRDTRAARCSMGTVYYQRIHRTENLETTIRDVTNSGCRVYGIEIGPDSVPVAPHGADRNWAMVLGNEDEGLSPLVQQSCDQIVHIPQAHGDSLNVGHAGSIAMFELGRECTTAEHDGRGKCS